MEWRTELHILPSTQKLNHSHTTMLMGSCFSQTIGETLCKYKFHALSNPFGTVFNPVSISRLLTYTCNPATFDAEPLLLAHGLFVHPDFYRTLGHENRDIAAARMSQTVQKAHQFLKHADFLFITLGTSTGFKLLSTGLLVSNCHKLPGSFFEKATISPQEGCEALSHSIKQLYVLNPGLNLIFTISPVRHTREGLIENSLSKARLRVMMELLQQRFPQIQYFPAYEWMTDDLRDYRFYQEDLIHPNDMAIQYIWEKFASHFFEKGTVEINHQVEKILKAVSHKPSFPDHPSYLSLVSQTNIAIQGLEEKFPNMDFSKEKKILFKT